MIKDILPNADAQPEIPLVPNARYDKFKEFELK
jgi:hypothetical protein